MRFIKCPSLQDQEPQLRIGGQRGVILSLAPEPRGLAVTAALPGGLVAISALRGSRARFAGFHGHVAGWFRRGPSLRSPTPASNASPPTPQASTRRCASLSAAQGHWPVNAQGQFTDAPQSRPPQTRPARSVFQEPRIQGPPSEAATTAVSSRVLSTPTHRATLRRRLLPGLQTESS